MDMADMDMLDMVDMDLSQMVQYWVQHAKCTFNYYSSKGLPGCAKIWKWSQANCFMISQIIRSEAFKIYLPPQKNTKRNNKNNNWKVNLWLVCVRCSNKLAVSLDVCKNASLLSNLHHS